MEQASFCIPIRKLYTEAEFSSLSPASGLFVTTNTFILPFPLKRLSVP